MKRYFYNPQVLPISRQIEKLLEQNFSEKENNLNEEFSLLKTKIIQNVQQNYFNSIMKNNILEVEPKKKPKKKPVRKAKIEIDFIHDVISLKGYPFENKKGYHKCLEFYAKVSKDKCSIVTGKLLPNINKDLLLFSPVSRILEYDKSNLKVSPLPISYLNSKIENKISTFSINLPSTIKRMTSLLEIEDGMLSENSTLNKSGDLETPFHDAPLPTLGTFNEDESIVKQLKELYEIDYIQLCKRIGKVHPFNFFRKKTVNTTNFDSSDSGTYRKIDDSMGLFKLRETSDLEEHHLNGLHLGCTDGNTLMSINLSKCIDKKIYENFPQEREYDDIYQEAVESVSDWEKNTYQYFESFKQGTITSVNYLAIQEAVKSGEIYVPIRDRDNRDSIGSYPFYSNGMNMHIYQQDDDRFPDVARVLRDTYNKNKVGLEVPISAINKKHVIKVLNDFSNYLFVKGISKSKTLITKGEALNHNNIFKTNSHYTENVYFAIVHNENQTGIGIYIRPKFDISSIDRNDLLNFMELKKGIEFNFDRNMVFINLYDGLGAFYESSKLILFSMKHVNEYLDCLYKIPNPNASTYILTDEFDDIAPLLFIPRNCGYFDKAVNLIVMPHRMG